MLKQPISGKKVINMPTILGIEYKPDWRGRPPHMLDPDVPVWWRFLEKYNKLFQRIFYDSLLGGPFLSPEQAADPYWIMWRANTSKRTDAIAELEEEVWIIEVTSNATMRAVGQLIVYKTLWLRDQPIKKPFSLVLVCEFMDNDVVDGASSLGIQTYKV